MLSVGMVFNQSCRIPDPVEKDFIGEWQSEDGARFSFENNGIFYTENLPGEKMFDGFKEYEKKKLNESGSWNITKSQGNWIMQLVFNSKQLNNSFLTQFYIADKNGIASNKPPWYLYKYIGDPDEGIMYGLYKVKP